MRFYHIFTQIGHFTWIIAIINHIFKAQFDLFLNIIPKTTNMKYFVFILFFVAFAGENNAIRFSAIVVICFLFCLTQPQLLPRTEVFSFRHFFHLQGIVLTCPIWFQQLDIQKDYCIQVQDIITSRVEWCFFVKLWKKFLLWSIWYDGNKGIKNKSFFVVFLYIHT